MQILSRGGGGLLRIPDSLRLLQMEDWATEERERLSLEELRLDRLREMGFRDGTYDHEKLVRRLELHNRQLGAETDAYVRRHGGY